MGFVLIWLVPFPNTQKGERINVRMHWGQVSLGLQGSGVN